MTRRPLIGGALLGALLVLSLAVPTSGANLTAVRTNPGNAITGDTPGRYLHGYSQATDPTGLTGYAVKAGAVPVTRAATGVDGTLAVNLGDHKNENNVVVSRVLVVSAPNPLPSGVTAVTVRVALAVDPVSGLQPIAATTFAPANGTGACVGSTVTLGAGQRCQLNITVQTRVNQGFVNNSSYTPTLYLIANFPGYTGSSFLDYAVPFTVSTS